jgi:hypothetical protein
VATERDGHRAPPRSGEARRRWKRNAPPALRGAASSNRRKRRWTRNTRRAPLSTVNSSRRKPRWMPNGGNGSGASRTGRGEARTGSRT